MDGLPPVEVAEFGEDADAGGGVFFCLFLFVCLHPLFFGGGEEAIP